MEQNINVNAQFETEPIPADCQPACELGPLDPVKRLQTAFDIRVESAQFRKSKGSQPHPCNEDEKEYKNRNFCASFSKALPHYATDMPPYALAGEVIPSAYCKLLKALATGDPNDFNNIPLGCLITDNPDQKNQSDTRFAPAGSDEAPRQRPLVNPQSALGYDLEGFDSHQLSIPKAPKFRSGEEAGEMIELYWMALSRDVPFSMYGKEPITEAAIKDLNNFIKNNPNEFKGPTEKDPAGNPIVTPRTLFRGISRNADKTLSELAGPYISQFMLLDVPFGAQIINQRINTVLPVVNPDGTPGAGSNYMTDFGSWLFVQNGCTPGPDRIDMQTKRYIRNGRDIGQYVHIDVLFQAYFNAMLLLLQRPSSSNQNTGFGARFDPGNPYPQSSNQEGFGTFGGPHIATLVCEVATRALKAVWYQKWSVHRRLRPEEFGGRVEKIRENSANRTRYDIHHSLFSSEALKAVENGIHNVPGTGTHLLPMAFPEGSPVHPAYGAGHATVAGACVTILKAWFDESQKLSEFRDPDGNVFKPKQAKITGKFDSDGIALEDYPGRDAGSLTVGSELNKLAANIGIGRNHAGVHWRSDHAESIRLGEQIAISVLEDQACTFNESNFKFSFTSFDGDLVEIGVRSSCPRLR